MGQNYEDKKVKGADEEVKKNSLGAATLVAFRIGSDTLPLYERMIKYFYDNGLIPKPKLWLLGKVSLNIIA